MHVEIESANISRSAAANFLDIHRESLLVIGLLISWTAYNCLRQPRFRLVKLHKSIKRNEATDTLTSRWMMLLSWQYRSASRICLM